MNSKIENNTKIAIFLILFYSLGINSWFVYLFNNLGIPNLKYQQLWFYLLPGMYLMLNAQKNNRLKLNNIILFIVFYVTHYFMENYSYSNYKPSDPIDLLWRMRYLFFTYLFLINTKKKYLEFVLKSVIWLMIIKTTMIYLDYFDIINVANIGSGFGSFEGRLNSTQNLNVVNDQNVFAMYCLFFLKYLKMDSLKFKKNVISAWLIVAYLFPLIILQASRGSLLLFLFGVLVLVVYKWRYLSILKKTLIVIGLVLIMTLQINLMDILAEKFVVVKRLKETPLSEESGKIGRVYQIIASWENFQKSPIIGLGYNNATAGVFHGITRSNFQYTQILASGGIVLFIIFYLFIFRLYFINYGLIKSDIIAFSLLGYVLILFIFRRPDSYFGIIAYITYVRSIERKTYYEKNINLR